MQLGATGGGLKKTYIEDVFSTYLYTGNGSTQSIDNGMGLLDTSGFTANALPLNGESWRWGAVDSGGNEYLSTSSTFRRRTPAGVNTITKTNATGSLNGQFVVDPSGNIYGPGSSVAVTKFDSTMTPVWARAVKLGVNWVDAANSVAVDASGNVYVSGKHHDNSAANTSYGYLVKFNGSGVLQWYRDFNYSLAPGNYPSCRGETVKIDSSGNAVLFVTSDKSSDRCVVAKFDPAGTLLWSTSIYDSTASSAPTSPGQMAMDANGDVYIAGYMGALGYGALVKINANGTVAYSKQFGAFGTSPLLEVIGGYLYVWSIDYIKNPLYKINLNGTVEWKASISVPYTYGRGAKILGKSDGSILLLAGSYQSGSARDFELNVSADGRSQGSAYVTIQRQTTTTLASANLSAQSISLGYRTSNPDGISTVSVSAPADATAPTITSYTQASATSDGGMVWIKGRSGATDHALYDTVRGPTYGLATNNIAAQTTEVTGLTAFNTNGFSVGTLGALNSNAATYASWTFRKTPKFFDVVTYTGNGVAGRTVSHLLGVVPGMILIKSTSLSTQNWAVFHRGVGATAGLYINATDAAASSVAFWNNTAPTSTEFSLGNWAGVNQSGAAYTAYLFAHDTTADGLIQCGSFTTNASGGVTGEVPLGYEPQFVMVKNSSSTSNWIILDVMSGFSLTQFEELDANRSAAAVGVNGAYVYPTATGFRIENGSLSANHNWIYMAIRRGPMRTPTDGSKVLAMSTRTGNATAATITAGITPDTVLSITRTGAYNYKGFFDRLRGWSDMGTPVLNTYGIEAESNWTTYNSAYLDQNNGFKVGTDAYRWVNGNGSSETYVYHMLKRAPGFYDVVCYTGTGVARTINHGLGVAPELYIIKSRGANGNWIVGGTAPVFASPTNNYLVLNSTNSLGSIANALQAPTATTIGIGTGLQGNADVNFSGRLYAVWLFASCPGVSKVGSYTGNGTSQTIDCGFTGGARFVLIKRTNATGDWFLWDTARGISASNDPHVSLNTSAAEVTTDDSVDPTAVGFIVNQLAATNINVNAATYIYLAIA